MASVNFIVPGFSKDRFSGGLLCLFEYANGFVKRGHNVRVLPLQQSPQPQWFNPKFEIINPPRTPLSAWPKALIAKDRKELRRLLGRCTIRIDQLSDFLGNWIAGLRAWERGMPEADVTICSAFQTAIVGSLYGCGRRYYFAQHFEPLFANDLGMPLLSGLLARQSYQLPDLKVIANSSWLANTLKHELNLDVEVCLNAIQHTEYFPSGSAPDDHFVLLSYGGRLAEWKGIHDAARAVRQVRESIPSLEWQVFGDSLLPPDNPIASYTPLGFLNHSELRTAYSQSHAILCPAWYESFPLYPLEAMACGSVPITTPAGTEDFAHDHETALIVPDRDPNVMATAIIRLANDSELRCRLRHGAIQMSQRFTWQRSIQRMLYLTGLS